MPAHASSYIAELGRRLSRLVSLQYPVQGGLEDRVIAQGGEDGLSGQTELQPAVDVDDGIALILIPTANNGTFYDSLTWLAILVRPLAGDEVQGFALVEEEQQLLADRIVAVVLLQDPQRTPAERIAQHNRVRLDVGRGVVEGDVVDPSLQVQRDRLPHHGEVVVVNGDRGLVAGAWLMLVGVSSLS